MNHIRQQAAGNCFAALYMGKVLVLNPENTMFSMFANWRILVYTPTVLSNLTKIEASQLLKVNHGILDTMLTYENALVEIGKLYE